MRPPARAPRRLRSTGDLRALQRLMAAAVMRPLTAASRTRRRWNDGRPAAAVIGSFIKPNDRLGAVERLEIYNRMYWFRLLDCLLEDFPGVRAVLGERRFLRLAEAYLARHPSRSFTLRNLGRGLPDFIRAEPRRTAPRTTLAGDMARFEWAQVEAFDGEGRPALTPAELADADPARLRLGLQPYLSLLALDYAVDDLVLAVKKDALRGDASNAPEAAPATGRSRPVRMPRRERVHLAVHRYEGTIYFKRLEPAAARLLAALQAGRTLTRACAEALPKRGAAAPATQRQLQAWFRNWAALGWFCRR
ncbi:MAG TPA: DNA-binding domain-containing protein [Opitutaceae bacterium]|nr:DNA-binding domain-containing protein [Opitutaceae bacterium]